MKRRRDRLPLILDWLCVCMDAQTMAWRLEVSIRTVRRDVAVLRKAGYRIDSSAGHGGGLLLRRQARAA